MIKKNALEAYQVKYENENLKKRVMRCKKQLTNLCNELDESLPKYTGWFVLLKKSGEGWEFLGFYNPDTAEENTEPEWDMCLPIPELETVEEWTGW